MTRTLDFICTHYSLIRKQKPYVCSRVVKKKLMKSTQVLASIQTYEQTGYQQQLRNQT